MKNEIKIHRHSNFKDLPKDLEWFNHWVNRLESLNQKKYERIEVSTSLGKTHIWGIHTENKNLEPLLLFPGARTTSLFWDLDNNLKNLSDHFRIYLIETNGLPNLSDGATPDIKGNGYGEWASELMEKLGIEKSFVAGASFGGLICMKLAIVAPEKIKAAFLFNAGCLQTFSLKWKNLYANLKPIFRPTEANVAYFLDTAVLYKPNHSPSPAAEKLLIDYEVFAIKRYKDKTQKPYYMNDELKKANVPVYVFEGDKDLLFPYEKSIQNAREKLPNLKEVVVFKNVGHGIETFQEATKTMYKIISSMQ
jgi:pimeloyl-ACP methyl ester carboxylesterase